MLRITRLINFVTYVLPIIFLALILATAYLGFKKQHLWAKILFGVFLILKLLTLFNPEFWIGVVGRIVSMKFA